MRSSPAWLLSWLLLAAAAVGCGSGRPAFRDDDGGDGPPDLATSNPGLPDLLGLDLVLPPPGCAEVEGCYTVYAHSDHVLYKIDLANKMLITVGPFKAPTVNGREDSITDLAVAADDTLWAVSSGSMYTVDSADGHVTRFGSVSLCGVDNIALTFTTDGKLYMGDHLGAFCSVDISKQPPVVTPLGMIGGNQALSGDIVSVADGTMYGTVYTLGDKSNPRIDSLVKIDPASGKVTAVLGRTDASRLFGLAFDLGQFFAFTQDGSGGVFTLDPKTGKATPYNAFKDPMTGAGIRFAGAAVNPRVLAPPPG